MYVVTGSTGQVGGAVVRALRAAGKEVRALFRDASKSGAMDALGAEPFPASVEDASRLEIGFERAEGVFIMTPPLYKSPDPRTEHALALAAIKHALQASHVPKVVFLSSIGAQQPEGTGAILKSYDMEQELFALSMDFISIRAAFFMENFLPLLPHVKESGKLPVTIEPVNRPIPMIATEDIGTIAARLLTEPWSGKRTIELEGPRQYSMSDVAAILSRQLGRTVEAELVPREGRQAMYESFGFTPGSSADMTEMADGWNSGLVAFAGGAGVEHMRGNTTPEEVFRDK
jgi:NAD(P)H dehydrogenase (quinone)